MGIDMTHSNVPAKLQGLFLSFDSAFNSSLPFFSGIGMRPDLRVSQ